jgi:nucleoside-diphosphate-sugar epimerase
MAGGYAVRALVRRPPIAGELPEGPEIVTGDLIDSDLTRFTRDVDVVVHLAAFLHVRRPSAELLTKYRQINVEGTRRLLDASVDAGVKRFVYFSTIAVYGPNAGNIIDESTPTAASTPYAESKRDAEKLVLASKIGVVLRLASVYGERMKGNYRSLVRALRRGTFIGIGRGENRRTLIHEDDAGRAALLAAESDAVVGRIFNVTDGSFHTITEIVAAISRALGRKPPRFHVPLGVARAGMSIVPGGRDLLDKYVEDMAVDGSRFQREIGFKPRVDLENGWQMTVRKVCK